MSGREPGSGAPPDGAAVWGLLAEYESPHTIYAACERLRDAGFTRWDAHTPFPVHGLDRAMGLAPSKVPWVVFVLAMLGAAGGMALQWWTSAVDYPLVIAGKPLFSWPAFIPVTFEVSVLLAAFGAVLGMFHFNRLPRLHHPLFASDRFARVTDDGFFISIEATDPKFHSEETRELLRATGAVCVEVIEDVA